MNNKSVFKIYGYIRTIDRILKKQYESTTGDRWSYFSVTTS